MNTGELSTSETGRDEPTSRLMALVFTDLIDSSHLKIQLGDAGYVEQIAQPHNAIFRELLARFPGAEENNYTGDGFLATFPSVNSAVNFALLFHHALRSRAWESIQPATRIGIHLGDTVEFQATSGDDTLLAGHSADMCARVMSLGAGGQTLLTRAACDSARQYVRGHPATGDDHPLPEIHWMAHGRYRFHGKDEPMEVFEVGALGWAPLEAPGNSDKARRALTDDEEQTLGWRPGLELEIPGQPNWFLREKLGVGGFGEVWLAQHAKLKEHRVFKFCFDAERLRSFKRELTLFRLIQEGLGERDDMARLLDVRVDSPPYFLESEYVSSGNLNQWYQRHGGGESVPLETRLKLLADVARAVAAAHSLGIIHKDIKPSNVFIEQRGDGTLQPKLADFGIGVLTDRALLAEHQVTEAGFTQSLGVGSDSSHTGTRMYAPPEAQLGKPSSTAGDVYALGVLLYQLVTDDLRQPLGVGWEAKIEDELLRDDITACTHGDPTQRLGSAAELADRLESLPARRQARDDLARAEAERLAAQQRVVHQKRRMRALKVGMGVAVLFVAVAIGASLWVNSARQTAEESNSQLQEKIEELDRANEQLTVTIEERDELYKQAREQLQDSANRAVNVLMDSDDDPQEWADIHQDLPADLLHSALKEAFEAEEDPDRQRRLALGISELDGFEVEVIASAFSALVATIDKAEDAECLFILRAMQRARDAALEAIHKAADSNSETPANESRLTSPDDDDPEKGEQIDEDRIVHHARLAILALLLGDSILAESVCDASDSTAITVLIHEFANWNGPLLVGSDEVADVEDPDLQYALCCAVGRLQSLTSESADEPDDTDGQQTGVDSTWPRILEDWYLNSLDSSVHSAAAMALRHHVGQLPDPSFQHEDLPWSEMAADDLSITMVRVPETEESESIGSFLVSDREVSVGLFNSFFESLPEDDRLDDFDQLYLTIDEDADSEKKRVNTPAHPMRNVSFDDAFRFCNWLSERFGRTPCYRREPDAWAIDNSANGFRLPTVSEWQHAARAGTGSLQFWGKPGRNVESAYAQLETHPRACGSLLPNRWGLFDVCGNVAELCLADTATILANDGSSKVCFVCGGSFQSVDVPADSRQSYKGTTRHPSIGFRILLANRNNAVATN